MRNIQSEVQVILRQCRSVEGERIFEVRNVQFHAGTVVEEL